MAVTSRSAELEIKWEEYVLGKSKSLRFTETPHYTFGIVLRKIYEFNDINDTGLIDTVDASNINILHPRSFRWDRTFFSKTNELVELHMEGHDYNNAEDKISRRGKIKLLFNGFCSLNHSHITPHMLHSENSTQIDLIIDHLQTNTSFLQSRFAIEVLLVSEGNSNSTMIIDGKKTLDDEHTPGIFEVDEIRTPNNNYDNGIQKMGAYIQWKPVSYTTAERDVTSSTDLIHYPLIVSYNHTKAMKNSLLFAFYDENVTQLLVQKINVSMGLKGDRFYKKTNYTTWTFIVGYGTPPDEQFSYLVIMIISIGIGLPLLIMISTGLYLCARRFRNQDSNVLLNR
ncbi:glycosylated lysosomal membrane protein isoform X2 [Cephus cinctus]|nr:glycosylated lysosomal membrane protein isoform X2 [Cephus cinctus]